MEPGGKHNMVNKRYSSEKYKEWYKKNSQKKLEYAKTYYINHREERILASKKYRLDRPNCWVESHRKRLYGIDNKEFNSLLASQLNMCGICSVVFDNSKKKTKPHIDHCHKTGKVRGLLCSMCNISLGHLEKPGFINSATRYLGRV
jgi:hypothetical protein